MSKLKVNSITNKTENGPVTFIKGAKIPSGYQLTITGGMNSTGIITATQVALSGHTNVTGVMTAQNMSGDGSALTGVPTVALAKIYALRSIITFNEFSMGQ